MAKDPSKTEKPTPKRIRNARKKGNVPKSQEVSTTITILAGLIGLYFWLGFIGKDLMSIFRYFLSTAITYFAVDNPAAPERADITSMMPWLALEISKMILPILFFIGFMVYMSIRLQVGKLWTMQPMAFKLSKLNPLKGVKRMLFSPQTFIRLGKSLAKAMVIGFAPVMVIKGEIPNFTGLYYTDAYGLASYILQMGFKMVTYALVPMMIITGVDLWYTRWSYIENLKMSKDEVKDEMKQQDGDPKVKAQQKQKMMQMSQRRMFQEIPNADVVLTNPTHLAVALLYNTSKAPAPMVIAKGAGRVAERIKEIARENKVPIRENKPLARALYKQVEIGDVIPEDLYQAVATILAQLWKAKGGRPPGS